MMGLYFKSAANSLYFARLFIKKNHLMYIDAIGKKLAIIQLITECDL